jgi:DNA-directed RNA polymerase specialized sigma24 family protein
LNAGKKSILLETYLLQRDALKRFLIARLGAEAEAEDLVQELYFRLDRAQIVADVDGPRPSS